MAIIITPLADENPIAFTKNRFRSLFEPIQKTNNKESDFCQYITRPVLDRYIFGYYYTLDFAINITNTIASLLKSCYLWDLGTRESQSLREESLSPVKHELYSACRYLTWAIADIIAPLFNLVFSVLGLVTRPVVSLAYALFGDGSNPPAAETLPRSTRGGPYEQLSGEEMRSVNVGVQLGEPVVHAWTVPPHQFTAPTAPPYPA